VELKYDHLLGKDYVPGSVHCYALVRAFFEDNFDLKMRDYVIPHDWNSDTIDLIEKIHEREGFFKVEDWTLKNLQPGDLLCVAVGASHANHFVIHIGNNLLLHHPLGQKSRTEPMRDFWRKQTCYVLRHPVVPNLTPALPDIDIMDLINDRYSVQAEA
jgi:cell wall-associated NlpC family hydrolase